MEKNLIIFDLDGTLTDSSPGIIKSIQYALNKMGREIPSQEVLLSFVGPPLNQQFKEVYQMSDEEVREAMLLFRENYGASGIFENGLFPGVREMLENLKKEGCVLSVATSKNTAMAKRVLEHFDLEKYFDKWQGADLEKRRADKMDQVKGVIDNNGFAEHKERAVMVGDRKYDALGAESCGIDFYGAGWGYAPAGELEGYPNKGIAQTPEMLFEMLLRRFTASDE